MNLDVRVKSAAWLGAMLVFLAGVAGQDKAQDRRKSLDPSTPVSGDPRRIPVKPGPSGPDRVLVDGTEAAAHRATLVIARNRIFKIFPASSTAWPRTPK